MILWDCQLYLPAMQEWGIYALNKVLQFPEMGRKKYEQLSSKRVLVNEAPLYPLQGWGTDGHMDG